MFTLTAEIGGMPYELEIAEYITVPVSYTHLLHGVENNGRQLREHTVRSL